MPLLEMKDAGRDYRQGRGFAFSGKSLPRARDGATMEALKPVSLSLAAGTTLGIIGESGAGKTTLGRLAAGLEEPSTGEVLLAGSKAGSLGKRRARIAQMIWQDARGSLDPRLRVEKIIAEPLRIHGIEPEGGWRKTVKGLLGEVGLGEEMLERYPHQLSGGEAQRVVIARALALKPELLICDEPASALDIGTKMKIAELLRRLREERQLAMIIIAHDLFLVRRLADEVIVMKDGSVMERGPAAAVLRRPENDYTRQLLAAEPVMKAPAASSARRRLRNDDTPAAYMPT